MRRRFRAPWRRQESLALRGGGSGGGGGAAAAAKAAQRRAVQGTPRRGGGRLRQRGSRPRGVHPGGWPRQSGWRQGPWGTQCAFFTAPRPGMGALSGPPGGGFAEELTTQRSCGGKARLRPPGEDRGEPPAVRRLERRGGQRRALAEQRLPSSVREAPSRAQSASPGRWGPQGPPGASAALLGKPAPGALVQTFCPGSLRRPEAGSPGVPGACPLAGGCPPRPHHLAQGRGSPPPLARKRLSLHVPALPSPSAKGSELGPRWVRRDSGTLSCPQRPAGWSHVGWGCSWEANALPVPVGQGSSGAVRNSGCQSFPALGRDWIYFLPVTLKKSSHSAAFILIHSARRPTVEASDRNVGVHPAGQPPPPGQVPSLARRVAPSFPAETQLPRLGDALGAQPEPGALRSPAARLMEWGRL